MTSNHGIPLILTSRITFWMTLDFKGVSKEDFKVKGDFEGYFKRCLRGSLRGTKGDLYNSLELDKEVEGFSYLAIKHAR